MECKKGIAGGMKECILLNPQEARFLKKKKAAFGA